MKFFSVYLSIIYILYSQYTIHLTAQAAVAVRDGGLEGPVFDLTQQKPTGPTRSTFIFRQFHILDMIK